MISTAKPIREVAESYGVGPETVRNWLIKYRDANGGTEEDLTLTERARLKELERENQDLRAETAFLKKPALKQFGADGGIGHGGADACGKIGSWGEISESGHDAGGSGQADLKRFILGSC